MLSFNLITAFFIFIDIFIEDRTSKSITYCFLITRSTRILIMIKNKLHF